MLFRSALVCDIELVDFSPLKDAGVDVVAGGPPCQDFSIVRGPDWNRRGIEVKRGRLYLHFVRALNTLRPRAFIFENVPQTRGWPTRSSGRTRRQVASLSLQMWKTSQFWRPPEAWAFDMK